VLLDIAAANVQAQEGGRRLARIFGKGARSQSSG
jgi:hypothetical protein